MKVRDVPIKEGLITTMTKITHSLCREAFFKILAPAQTMKITPLQSALER